MTCSRGDVDAPIAIRSVGHALGVSREQLGLRRAMVDVTRVLAELCAGGPPPDGIVSG